MSVSSENVSDSSSEEVSGSLTCKCLLIVRDPDGLVGVLSGRITSVSVMCPDTAQSGALLGAGTDDGAFSILSFLLNPLVVTECLLV